MPSDSPATTASYQGWTWVLGSRKWHYIRNGRSLCYRWDVPGDVLEDNLHNSPDNCKTCRRARERGNQKPKETSDAQ